MDEFEFELGLDALLPPGGEIYRSAVSSPSGDKTTLGAQLVHLFTPRTFTRSPESRVDPNIYLGIRGGRPTPAITAVQLNDMMNFEDPKSPYAGSHFYGRRALGHLNLNFVKGTPSKVQTTALEHLNPSKYALFHAISYRNRLPDTAERPFVSYAGSPPLSNSQPSTKVRAFIPPQNFNGDTAGFNYKTGEFDTLDDPEMNSPRGFNYPESFHSLMGEGDVKSALGLGHRLDTEYEPSEGNTPESPFYRMGGRDDRRYRFKKIINDQNPKIKHLIYAVLDPSASKGSAPTHYGAVTRVGGSIFHHSEIESLKDLEDHIINFGKEGHQPKTTTWGAVPFTPEIAPVDSYRDGGEPIFRPIDEDTLIKTKAAKLPRAFSSGGGSFGLIRTPGISIQPKRSEPAKLIVSKKVLADRGYKRGVGGDVVVPAKDLLDEGLGSISSEVGSKIQGLAVQKYLKKAARVMGSVEKHHKIFKNLLSTMYNKERTPHSLVLDPDAITDSHVTGHLSNILSVIGSTLRFLNYKKHVDIEEPKTLSTQRVPVDEIESGNNPSDQEMGIASRSLMTMPELQDIKAVLPQSLKTGERRYGEGDENKQRV